MSRLLCLVPLLFAAGCQLPPDRLPVRALPEESPPLPYAELLTRSRLQATAATEAFYVNQWVDLEDTARGLEQTARFLAKAIEVPESHRASVAADAKDLLTLSHELAAAAKAQDVAQTNAVLQRIHLKVRQLRPENSKPEK